VGWWGQWCGRPGQQSRRAANWAAKLMFYKGCNWKGGGMVWGGGASGVAAQGSRVEGQQIGQQN